ncbi:hypothetical protein HYV79_03620 [Candidatus Woesearchaeota archaeon]|nr:hypothetical protein [Candidatus Woesearchaeota archaeon]
MTLSRGIIIPKIRRVAKKYNTYRDYLNDLYADKKCNSENIFDRKFQEKLEIVAIPKQMHQIGKTMRRNKHGKGICGLIGLGLLGVIGLVHTTGSTQWYNQAAAFFDSVIDKKMHEKKFKNNYYETDKNFLHYKVELVLEENMLTQKFMNALEMTKERFKEYAGIEIVISNVIELPDVLDDYMVKSKINFDITTALLLATNQNIPGFKARAYRENNSAIFDKIDEKDVFFNANLIQHEISHLLGLPDRNIQDYTGDIMNNPPYWSSGFRGGWTSEDIEIMRRSNYLK